MGKVISIQKFLKKKNVAANDSENESMPSSVVIQNTEQKKGWYFASLDESDVATILRFLGFAFGFIFFMVAIPAGFTDWVQRGLFFSGLSLAVSYLLVIKFRS